MNIIKQIYKTVFNNDMPDNLTNGEGQSIIIMVVGFSEYARLFDEAKNDNKK